MEEEVINEEQTLPMPEEDIDRIVEEAHTEIPVNSATLLVDERTSRFSSAVWYEEIQKKTIILAGLGGIGSYVNFLLARMQPKSLFIYDNDIVEAGNMSGQLYGNNHLGQSKITASADIAKNFANYDSIFAVDERFTTECEPADIMICGFDNMGARNDFFSVWFAHVQNKPEEQRKNCLFIDGRLAAEEFQVFCIRGDDEYNIQKYNTQWLFSDSEADATICSYKQTTFCANMIGSIIVNLFVNFCANSIEGENAPLIPRDMPFLTTYNAETMYFKTEA